jgi:hypothetical protein
MTGTLLAEVHLRMSRDAAARRVLEQVRSLTAPMRADFFYAPELRHVEAKWLGRAGRHADARRLLLDAIRTARRHGSWALAIRSALELARSESPENLGDLELLRELSEQLPADNDTDYAREARALVAGHRLVAAWSTDT